MRLLAWLESSRQRTAVCVALSLLGGPSFAWFGHTQIRRPDHPYVLETTIGTMFLNHMLGRPLDDPGMEADPALFPEQPNFARFCRTVAAGIKDFVGDQRTTYDVCVQGLGAMDWARGWPFVSLDWSYRVMIDEWKRFDGKTPRGIMYRVGQDGHPPVRPWAFAANAAVGGTAIGLLAFAALKILRRIARRFSRQRTGFPIVVIED